MKDCYVLVSLVFLLTRIVRSEHVLQGGQIILENPNSDYFDKYLIELSPDETRWVTEEEKWALRRVRCVFHYFTIVGR